MKGGQSPFIQGAYCIFKDGKVENMGKHGKVKNIECSKYGLSKEKRELHTSASQYGIN
jgi:hypothetical protein